MTDTAQPAAEAIPTTTRPHRTRSIIVRVVIAVAVIGAVVLYLRSRGHDAKAVGMGSGSGSGSDARVVPVQVVKPERTDLPIWLEGLGTVAAVQQVTVRAQVDGRLDKVNFVEGQSVKAGEVIAQIDPRPFMVLLHTAQGQLARDKAQLKNAETTLERDKGLHAQNLIAQATVDLDAAAVGQAQGSVQIDQAAIESAQLQLDYAAIKSPANGVTGVRLVDAGNIIHATDTTGIVVVTAIDEAAVFFTVPQDKLGPIALAQSRGAVDVEVWSRDGATKIETGKLAVLDNQVNQTTATLRLKALIPNLKHVLWPNAFVKARMLLETRQQALVVPTVAIQQGPTQGPDGLYVYVVGPDNKAVMKTVTVTVTSQDKSVIDKGLDGTELVVIEGQNQLRPGGKVALPGEGGGGSGSGGGRRHGAGGSGSGGSDGTQPAKPTL